MVRFILMLLILQCAAFAASADVTTGTNGREIEADTTQRTATLNSPGGTLTNKSSDSVWLQLDSGTVGTASGSISLELRTDKPLVLPVNCRSFTFKTASGTSYVQYVGR